MTPQLATIVFAVGIAILFALDRDRGGRTSKALWLPVAWLLITGSREVSRWLATFGMGSAGGTIGSPEQLADGNPIDRWVFTGLFVIGLLALIGRRRQVASILKANIPVVSFFVYCGVSVLWSDYSDISFKRWIKAIGDLVMVLIVLTDRDRLLAMKRVLTRPAFLIISISVLLIKYYPQVATGYKEWSGVAVYTGVATNKNILGVVLLLFGLASEWCFLAALKARRTRHLVAHGIVLAMVIWLFAMANSMTSLCCFVLAGLLLAAASRRAMVRQRWIIPSLVALIVIVSFLVLFAGLGTSSLETLGRDPTLTGRTAIWKLVIRLSGNPIVGTGFESFWMGPRLQEIWSVYWWHPNEAHNGYLEVFLNLGWVGVALLALLLATGYRNVMHELRQNSQLGQLKLAYFVVGVIYNFTEAGFRMLDPIWIMFLVAIMAVPRLSGITKYPLSFSNKRKTRPRMRSEFVNDSPELDPVHCLCGRLV
jgi:exopolysaccharide production protein ExoQ